MNRCRNGCAQFTIAAVNVTSSFLFIVFEMHESTKDFNHDDVVILCVLRARLF